MPLEFVGVSSPPLRQVSLRFDDGIVAGLVGPDDAGIDALLRLGAERGGTLVEAGPGARARLDEALATSPRVLLIEHALSLVDAAFQVDCMQRICALQRRGAVVLIASHDLHLLERVCDVVVALDQGQVVEQGDPGLVLSQYRRRMLDRARARAGQGGEVLPASRHGDGRAEVQSIEILGENGSPATTMRSGENMTIRTRLHFHEAVDHPVVGIQIRSRIGVVVYGTNTELENVEVGVRRRGETVQVAFTFRCDLCPQEYTLTVASHDPDGTAHDWLDEAVLFSVIDDRYTAGVANLRARVTISPG